MNLIWKILDYRMNTPIPYDKLTTSWFHYLSLLLTIGIFIALTRFFKKANTKQTKRAILIIGIIMLLFEIYKQVIFTYQANEYQWYAFPFQFCSTPMYLFVIYGLSKNSKTDDYILSFIATYTAFAGLAVMLYPVSVFVSTVGINIQTMIHHGLMMAVGFAILITKASLIYKTVLKGSTIFVILMAIAYLLNTLFEIFIHNGTFNMFFISPKFGTEIPVLTLISGKVPHVVFLLIYALGFSLMATIILLIGRLIKQSFLKTEKQLVKVFAR